MGASKRERNDRHLLLLWRSVRNCCDVSRLWCSRFIVDGMAEHILLQRSSWAGLVDNLFLLWFKLTERLPTRKNLIGGKVFHRNVFEHERSWSSRKNQEFY